VARRENLVDQLPVKVSRPVTMQKRFLVFLVRNRRRFLVCQRPDGGVNARLWEFPNIEVHESSTPTKAHAKTRLEVDIKSVTAAGKVQYSITHHRITAEVFWIAPATLPRLPLHNHLWASQDEVDRLPMTAAHRKIWQTLVIAHGEAK
jgi:A/G-specific adenine glycosylase